MRTTLACTLALVLVAAPTGAYADGRQLHLGPILGFDMTDGQRGGYGGLVGAHGGYDLNDTWRIYANAQYGLAAADAADTPRHAITVSAGVVYMIDVLRILPWVGAGIEGSWIITPAWTGVVPLVEARGGVDYLVSRYFGFTVHVAYGFALVNRDQLSDMFDVVVGLRWTVDL